MSLYILYPIQKCKHRHHICLTKYLGKNSGDKMWYPGDLEAGPQCTMCHMPPPREGQLVTLHTLPTSLGIFTTTICPYFLLCTVITSGICVALIKNDGSFTTALRWIVGFIWVLVSVLVLVGYQTFLGCVNNLMTLELAFSS